MTQAEERATIRRMIRTRIRERGTDYAMLVLKDQAFQDAEVQDIKEELAYEYGVEFDEE
ncbi:MAG: hypothetical protein ACYS7Y_34615 [Planctomycetota bacterium]|jgi:hypothetical protein